MNFKNEIYIILLIFFLLSVSGCTSLHPRMGRTSPKNTAYPPEFPPRPEPIQPTIEYEHRIREDVTRNGQRSKIVKNFKEIYKKQGAPKFSYLFISGEKIVKIQLSPQVKLRFEGNAEWEKERESSKGVKRESRGHSKITSTLTGERREIKENSIVPHLDSAEQGVYDVLSKAGVYIIDCDVSTVMNIDQVLKYIDAGTSFDTSKLKSALSNSVDVLLIYQFIDNKEFSKMIGRAVSVREGFKLLARDKVCVYKDLEGGDSYFDNILWKSKVRILTVHLLKRIMENWEEQKNPS